METKWPKESTRWGAGQKGEEKKKNIRNSSPEKIPGKKDKGARNFGKKKTGKIFRGRK